MTRTIRFRVQYVGVYVIKFPVFMDTATDPRIRLPTGASSFGFRSEFRVSGLAMSLEGVATSA